MAWKSAKNALFHPIHSPHRLYLSKATDLRYQWQPATPSQILMADRVLRVGHSSRVEVVHFWRAAKPGICALPPSDQSAIREKVELFDAFTPDNDPHQERDFGSFDHAGQTIFWKIDYYDPTLTCGSEDPSDPRQTVRVLTIMLAAEY